MKLPKLTTSLLVLSLAIGGYTLLRGNVSHPTNDKDIAATTAMITNLRGNSGGTGVILSSNAVESKILTNAHVCGVVKFGGIVTSDRSSGTVSSYQISQFHDLCLITTNVDMEQNTEVSKEAPGMYSEAIVSGHPSLLPTIITRGMFSHREVISVMTGFRECSKEELNNPDLGMLCMFLGGLPVIKTYAAQVTSATISPGSSGSAVFDGSGRIAGLVFAGAGPLSYGHIVPSTYVYNFVKNEVQKLPSILPLEAGFASMEQSARTKLKSTCTDGPTTLGYALVREFCKYISQDTIYEE